MSALRDAAQQALEALEWADNAMYEGTPIQANTQKAITALRTALAEQPAEQEPVAWWHRKSNKFTSGNLVSNFAEWAPLYTAPQPVKREPSAGGVLFAVEQAIQNGDCPWQIEQAFHEYEAERKNGIGEQT